MFFKLVCNVVLSSVNTINRQYPDRQNEAGILLVYSRPKQEHRKSIEIFPRFLELNTLYKIKTILPMHLKFSS